MIDMCGYLKMIDQSKLKLSSGKTWNNQTCDLDHWPSDTKINRDFLSYAWRGE